MAFSSSDILGVHKGKVPSQAFRLVRTQNSYHVSQRRGLDRPWHTPLQAEPLSQFSHQPLRSTPTCPSLLHPCGHIQKFPHPVASAWVWPMGNFSRKMGQRREGGWGSSPASSPGGHPLPLPDSKRKGQSAGEESTDRELLELTRKKVGDQEQNEGTTMGSIPVFYQETIGKQSRKSLFINS